MLYRKHNRLPTPVRGSPDPVHHSTSSSKAFLDVPSPTNQTFTTTESSFSGGLSSPTPASTLTLPRSPSPSLSLSPNDPLARVFPLPPSGTDAPIIRPGSVRSVTLERQHDSPEDDRASRRSVRSFQAKVRPPMPPPPDPETILPMVHALEAALNRDTLAAATGGKKTSRTAEHNLELGEASDHLGALSSTSEGVIGSFDKRHNRSVMSLGAKTKAEKVLGGDPQPRLASLYLVSGLGKDPAQWALSDKDATLGVQPMEDSLSVFWRPDMLGSTFSGEKSEDWNARQGKSSNRSLASATRRDLTAKAVPGAGPEGASRLVARTMKYAHPKDVEVVNSTLAPPTTCHTFTFSVARQNSLTAIAAQANRNTAPGQPFGTPYNNYSSVSTESPSAVLPGPGQEHLRGTTSSSDLVFYGVTLTVWSHADKDRAAKLKDFKNRAAHRPRQDSTPSDAGVREKSRRRTKAPWLSSKRPGATSDYTASETGMSDSDLDTTFTSNADFGGAYGGDPSDIFWMPYALTLVSRYPIYDVMQDYLRLSWARYAKDARAHMRQIFTLLNSEAPRPGDKFRLPISIASDEEVAIEAVMPGALDFEKGTLKVDFQMWPMFQALDLDHIITCVEVALSNSGRVIFCSRHPAVLGAAVDTLKYLVELRSWNGIALPNIHSRDATFLIEDPGPYIIGIATECRYIVPPPAEVVIVDLDLNTLSCKAMPAGIVTPRHKRDKARSKLIQAFGPEFPNERAVPLEYRVSFPKGAFRNINRVHHGPIRPRYLADRLEPPQWWNPNAVVAVFDKIMADKHKKPSLFQRLTKSGFARAQEQLTANELLAKAMMRKRALHYVEKRDDFELKVARITRRLQKLIQEGEHWKQRFEMFEKYAERLSIEAAELKAKIDREQREARRLSNLNSQQTKQNAQLQEKLSQTESARAEAMRQLSDMHHSIQELERERNEIMDIIEMQITSALQQLPGDGEHERELYHGHGLNNTTPPHSPPGSPRTDNSVPTVRRKSTRPGTRDSTQTTFTIETHPMSVIGALHEGSVRRGLGSILDMDQVSTADRVISSSKNETIAARVAMIQAKLELALAPVQKLVNEQSDSETVEGDEHDDAKTESEAGTARRASLDKPVQTTPPSSTDDHSPNGKTVDKPKPKPKSKSKSKSSKSSKAAEIEVTAPSEGSTSPTASDFTPVTETDDTDTTTDTDRAPPPEPTPKRHSGMRAFVLRPPPRRVAQKKSYESLESATSEGKKPRVVSAKEVLLTPVESSELLNEFGAAAVVGKKGEADRSSVVSNATVTFGTR